MTAKPKSKILEIIQKLLSCIEEEDIGISLLTTQYQDAQELAFFSEEDAYRVLSILKGLADDSHRHKKMIREIIRSLGERIDS